MQKYNIIKVTTDRGLTPKLPTFFLVASQWFSDGPIRSYCPVSDPLPVHAAYRVLGILYKTP